MDFERLQQLDTEKLKDVAKNYQRYGLDSSMHQEAIRLLKLRGFEADDLLLLGLFENPMENRAEAIARDFQKSTRVALFIYLALFALNLALPFLKITNPNVEIGILTLACAFFVSFLVFLMKSFFYQHEFYDVLGRKNRLNSAVLFMVLGIPLYFVLFILIRKEMKENLSGAGI
jgi:lipopolysaccharide export system permease protein